ncbi:hypothetical protein CA51_34230 [Rosistilla oblonga]|uniref:hypothetical protein n=1 Tax=Rosistilla oblonga TaxID=2527990 RepID=UPI00118C02D6|nr:hypothetical protein [Rosistilla oblonga]QDV13533.1 hypothetical protein CA51_34230 [Rosistilla oblonga]
MKPPIYFLFVESRCVATLADPRVEEMFWCSFRIEPVDQWGDAIVHDPKTWETVGLVIKDHDGNVTNPHVFSGGFDDFCDRKTDRLAFRSLFPTAASKRSCLRRKLLSAFAKLFGSSPAGPRITEY